MNSDWRTRAVPRRRNLRRRGLGGDAAPVAAALRPGVSLMEVLFSTFILSIGLISLAALIPVGRFTIAETSRSDYAAACGRAALRDLSVQRMLDYRYWVHPNIPANFVQFGQTTNLPPFAIDPYGVLRGPAESGSFPKDYVGGLGFLPRVSLRTPAGVSFNFALAERFFMAKDDEQFNFPSDRKLRPEAIDLSGDNAAGHYTWLATVTPAASERGAPVALKKTFQVSVAVCHKRVFRDDSAAGIAAEQVAQQVAFLPGGAGVALGGGTVRVNPPLLVRPRQWLLLADGAQCHWYRVVSAPPRSDVDPRSELLALAGPDWVIYSGAATRAVVVQTVVGVYSTVVEIDTDPTWNKYR